MLISSTWRGSGRSRPSAWLADASHGRRLGSAVAISLRKWKTTCQAKASTSSRATSTKGQRVGFSDGSETGAAITPSDHVL